MLLLAGFAALSSCSKVCDTGYEGEHCTTEVRTKYLGTFSGRQTCGAVTDTFTVAIGTVANDVTKIKIYNIYNSTLNATGTVLDNGSITIASQSLGSGTISGSVTNSSGKINIAYTVSVQGSVVDNCTWVQN